MANKQKIRSGNPTIPIDFFFKQAAKPVPLTSTYKRVLYYSAEENPLNKENIFCFIFNGIRYFLIDDIMRILGAKYTTIANAITRLMNRQTQSMQYPYFRENIDVMKVNPVLLNRFEEKVDLHHQWRSKREARKDVWLLSERAIHKLTSYMRSEYAEAFNLMITDRIFDEIEKKRLGLPNVRYNQISAEIILPLPGCHIAKNGIHVDSEAECQLLDLLDCLGIRYQYGKYLSVRVLNEYAKEHIAEKGVNFDLLLLDYNWTIIEYWGLKTPSYIENRDRKTAIYQTIGIKLISIEAEEIDNIPELRKRIIRELKIKTE